MKFIKASIVNLVSSFLSSKYGSYFSLFLVFFIDTVKSDAQIKNCNKKTVILALSPNRFRGDLEILVNTGLFTVYKISPDVQDKVIGLINCKKLNRNMKVLEYLEDESNIAIRPSFLKNFGNFLRPFIKFKKIDMVMSAAFNYKRDIDWAEAAKIAGVKKYIVCHRENLKTNKLQRDALRNQLIRLGKFKGDHLIVHNRIVSDIVSDCGFCESSQVSALGALRMDEFVNNLPVVNSLESKKTITLFSFNHSSGLIGVVNAFCAEEKLGYIKLFNSVHVDFARLAMKFPKYNFVIKVKWKGDWDGFIEKAWHENKIDYMNIPNLSITDSIEAHDLIKESRVVTGFGSTSLLEAALYRLPIVYPMYFEAVEERFKDAVQFYNELDIFKVASSPDDFMSIMSEYINCPPTIDEACMRQRERIFEKYVSPMQGNSVELYTDKILSVVN